jgi:hypothetical protein
VVKKVHGFPKGEDPHEITQLLALRSDWRAVAFGFARENRKRPRRDGQYGQRSQPNRYRARRPRSTEEARG